jgi:hypothetical protein
MNQNYCRPATGTASANCRLGTRTEVSSIYRARTIAELDQEIANDMREALSGFGKGL